MKKIIWVLATCCLLSVMTSCTSNSSSSQAPAAAPSPSPSSQPALGSAATSDQPPPPLPDTSQQAGPSPSNSPPLSAQSRSDPDPCKLLTPEDVKATQGESFKESKASGQLEGSLSVSQCFFSTPTFTKSVSLQVVSKGALGQGQPGPKQLWEQQFHRDDEREGARGGEKGAERESAGEKRGGEEEEKGQKPQRVAGVGDEAFWVGSRVGGALYVSTGERYFRLSIGGADDQDTKIKKTSALARRVLRHLRESPAGQK